MAAVNLPQNWSDVSGQASDQTPENATPSAHAVNHPDATTRQGIMTVNYELGLLTNVVALIAENFANNSDAGDFVHQQMYGALWHIKHQLEAAQSTLEDIGRGRSVEAKP
jgi:hypothetical protein